MPTNGKLPRRVKKVTIDGAVFSLAAPTHNQTREYARHLDSNGSMSKEERVKAISQFVCDSLNEATSGLDLKPEGIDDAMDSETFAFLYRELLKLSGFTLKEEGQPL